MPQRDSSRSYSPWPHLYIRVHMDIKASESDGIESAVQKKTFYVYICKIHVFLKTPLPLNGGGTEKEISTE